MSKVLKFSKKLKNFLFLSAQSGSADRTRAYCNHHQSVCVYVCGHVEVLKMLKISQDHFKAILSIFHFLAMFSKPPPFLFKGGFI